MSALCCRYIRISPRGRLFFDMGAPCNDCLLEKAFGNITFGSLNSMALDGTDIQPYAQGGADSKVQITVRLQAVQLHSHQASSRMLLGPHVYDLSMWRIDCCNTGPLCSVVLRPIACVLCSVIKCDTNDVRVPVVSHSVAHS